MIFFFRKSVQRWNTSFVANNVHRSSHIYAGTVIRPTLIFFLIPSQTLISHSPCLMICALAFSHGNQKRQNIFKKIQHSSGGTQWAQIKTYTNSSLHFKCTKLALFCSRSNCIYFVDCRLHIFLHLIELYIFVIYVICKNCSIFVNLFSTRKPIIFPQYKARPQPQTLASSTKHRNPHLTMKNEQKIYSIRLLEITV